MQNVQKRFRAAAGSEIVIKTVTRKDGTNGSVATIFEGDASKEVWCKGQMEEGFFDLNSYVIETFTTEGGVVYESLVAFR